MHPIETITSDTITSLLADVFLSRNKSYPRKKALYASDLGAESCRLEFFHRIRGAASLPSTPGELLMFQQGENLEEQVADALAEGLVATSEWQLVGRQTTCSYRDVNGKLDVLLRHVPSNTLCIIEVKSKRGKAFSFLNAAKPNNKIQTQFYEQATGAEVGFLVYVDREGQNFVRVFEVAPDKDAVDAAIDAGELLFDDANEPEPLTPILQRRENKGPDSLVLDMPWQVNWCRAKECLCKKRIGKIPDGKIVAKAQKDADGNITNITMLDGYEGYEGLVTNLARANGWLP